MLLGCVGIGILAVVACQRGAAPKPSPAPSLPTLPVFAFEDVLTAMRQLAATAPPAPSTARMRELAEFVDRAAAGPAMVRTQQMAQRSLLAEPDADAALEAGLAHEDAAVRSQCAFQLGERARVAAIPLLLARLRQDEKDGQVQAWLIDTLSKLGCLGALDKLVPLFDLEETAQAAGRVAIDVLRRVGRTPQDGASWAQLADAITTLRGEWLRTGALPGVDVAAEPLVAIDAVEASYRARLAHVSSTSRLNLRPVDNARYVFARIGRTGLPFVAQILRCDHLYVRRYGVEIVLERLQRRSDPRVDRGAASWRRSPDGGGGHACARRRRQSARAPASARSPAQSGSRSARRGGRRSRSARGSRRVRCAACATRRPEGDAAT